MSQYTVSRQQWVKYDKFQYSNWLDNQVVYICQSIVLLLFLYSDCLLWLVNVPHSPSQTKPLLKSMCIKHIISPSIYETTLGNVVAHIKNIKPGVIPACANKPRSHFTTSIITTIPVLYHNNIFVLYVICKGTRHISGNILTLSKAMKIWPFDFCPHREPSAVFIVQNATTICFGFIINITVTLVSGHTFQSMHYSFPFPFSCPFPSV